MPPKYPFVLLPLFLVTSYYFYKINMQLISEIYILLYLFFLLSYIFARHWIIPFIFNFLPGLIPGLMTNQLAALGDQFPSVGWWAIFNALAVLGIGAGFSLRYGLAGYGSAKGFRKGFKVFLVIVGVFLVILLILASVGFVIGSGLSPINWVSAIYLISPIYFATSIVTQLKHSEYKRSWSSLSGSNTSVQKHTTPPVQFWIRGLPKGTPVVIVVNGTAYTTTSDYLRVQQKGVNEYRWSALEVTVNNQTYVPHVRSGVLNPGQGIMINYYPATQTQAPQPSQSNQYVTFIVRGLPPSKKATIIVEGIAYTTDSTLVVSTDGQVGGKGR